MASQPTPVSCLEIPRTEEPTVYSGSSPQSCKELDVTEQTHTHDYLKHVWIGIQLVPFKVHFT